ncbi:TetR/AcrR family transcriptional regulator [Bacillus sp. DJP31]|uniref:TetR/AcrR family transcriptional regulator n=1 Tax=Bacillus sp. DJP31 TaxID=3409789 RepID=UPI003BB4E9EB
MVRGEGQREKILNAAREVFGSKGFFDTKMIEIAERANVSKGTIYLYFESKEKLYSAMHAKQFEMYIVILSEKVDRFSTLKDKLICIAEEHLNIFYKNRERSSMFLQAYNNDPAMIETLHTFFRNYNQYVSDLLEQEGIEGPKEHAKCFSGILDSYQRDIFFNPDFDYSSLLKAVLFSVNLFLNGCSGQRNQ